MTNFGDELSPAIVEAVTGQRVEWARPKKADLIGVGSILELAINEGASNCVVWGSGLRHPAPPEIAETVRNRNIETLAVRGPSTRDGLELEAGTILGDPGLLAPTLVSSAVKKTGRKILVPHFRMWSSSAGRGLLRQAESNGLHVLPPTLSPQDMVNAIASASIVYSSSLHGIIVADSIGVPVVWVYPPKAGVRPHASFTVENDFKYVDYFSSLSIDRQGLEFESLLFDLSDEVIVAAQTEAAMVSAAVEELANNLACSLARRFS